MPASDTRPAAPPLAALPGIGYRSWFLFVMVLVSASEQAERYMLSVLVEPIRAELHLSDTAIGAVKDLAIALIYIAACIPVARVADRWSKRKVVAIAATIWSVSVLVCGAAKGFWMLLIGRAGIGLGEGSFTPPSQAWIADLFPLKSRATALSIFLFGATFGSFAGPAFGGWAGHVYGWRTAMLLASIPGFILAPIVWFTLRDTPPGLADGGIADDEPKLGFGAALRSLMALRTLPLIVIASGLNALTTTGLISWAPAFVARVHHMPSTMIGQQMGLALLAGSFIGHSVGGPLADWLGRRDLRWYIWLPMLTGAASAIVGWFTLTGPAELVFPLFGVQVLISGMAAAPLMAVVTGLAPLAARATAVAVLMVTIQVIGLGGGPNLVGVLSDLLHPSYGEASIGVAMRYALLAGVPSTILLFLAGRHYARDHAAARAAIDHRVMPLDGKPLPTTRH